MPVLTSLPPQTWGTNMVRRIAATAVGVALLGGTALGVALARPVTHTVAHDVPGPVQTVKVPGPVRTVTRTHVVVKVRTRVVTRTRTVKVPVPGPTVYVTAPAPAPSKPQATEEDLSTFNCLTMGNKTCGPDWHALSKDMHAGLAQTDPGHPWARCVALLGDTTYVDCPDGYIATS